MVDLREINLCTPFLFSDNSSKLTGVTLPEPEGNRSNTAGRMKDSTASPTASVPREVEVMEGSGAEEFVTGDLTRFPQSYVSRVQYV